MGYRVPIKAYGKLKKEQIQYMWVSEAGACEKCQALDGKIYNTADEIPDKPHPNCKCWIDLIENPDVITDPIEQIRAEKREEESVKLELLKLEGDIKCLEDECDILLDNLQSEEYYMKQFDEYIINNIENTDELNIEKENLDIAKKELQNTKEEIQKVKDNLYNINIEKNETEQFNYYDKIYFKTKIALEEYVANDMTKFQTYVLGYLFSKKFNLPEAYNLLRIALEQKYHNFWYIRKNGKFYNSIYDLDNVELQIDIAKRVNMEYSNTDVPVFILNKDSSLSMKITKSNALKNFLEENINNIISGEFEEDKDIVFKNNDPDLYAALHGANVKNVQFTENGDLYLEVQDLYDFDPDRPSAKARLGRRLQVEGQLDMYYIICPIIIPKDRIIKLLEK